MAKILALVNQKGGVGKSTMSVHLAIALAIQGYRTLLIDADPQANSTYSLGVEADEDSCLQVFVDRKTVKTPPIRTADVLPDVQVDVLPAWITMGLIERWPDIKSAPDPKTVTQKVRQAVEDRHYDWVIVDGPPHLGYWNQVVLDLADRVLIPVPQSGNYPLVGLMQIASTIESVRLRDNPRLQLLGVVSTMVDRRTQMGRTALDRLKIFAEDMYVFEAQIPHATAVEWAQADKASNLFATAPEEPVAMAVVQLMEEVKARWQTSVGTTR